MKIAAGDESNIPQDLLAEEAVVQRIPLSRQASEGVHRQSRLVNVRAPTSAIPWILASAQMHQNIEWARSWVVNDDPDAAVAFDFEWLYSKRIAQLGQGQRGHRPVQSKWTDVCNWLCRLKRWGMTDWSWVKLGSSASRAASREIAVIDDQRKAKAELLLVMLTAMGYSSLPQGRSAFGVPGVSSVFSSFEGLAWCAVACAAEGRWASSDSAGQAIWRDRRQHYHPPRGGRDSHELAVGGDVVRA